MHIQNKPSGNIAIAAKDTISGLILAGGQGKRFNGQDKGLLPFKGTTLVEYAIKRLTPDVNEIIISANRNPDFYSKLQQRCVKDIIPDYSGPLAGIHAALSIIETEWLISIACDTPCFPNDYVKGLTNKQQQTNARLVLAQSHGQLQNVFMLVHKSLFTSLDTFLKSGERKAQIWIKQNNPAIAEFNKNDTAFYNINTAEDLNQLEKLSCDD